eukprot:m.224161 g.224161  ORF g.224161 m.224161 type:complete len:316 (+) comp18766_c1_seq2:260-1207(+)
MADAAGGTRQHQVSFPVSYALAGVSAVASRIAPQPIRVVRATMQKDWVLLERDGRPFKGYIDCLKWIRRNHGIAELWRVPHMVRSSLSYFNVQGLHFAFKGTIEHIGLFRGGARSDTVCLRLASNMAVGALAAGTYNALTLPWQQVNDLLVQDANRSFRTRNRQYSSLFDACKQTWTKQGLSGFYQGTGPYNVCSLLYRAFYFGLYDTAIASFSDDSGFLVRFGVAYATTMTADLASFPAWTVYRRTHQYTHSKESPPHTSALGCAKHILRDEGIQAFYFRAAGFGVRSLAGAGTLACFDTLKRLYTSSTHTQDT